MVAFVSNVTPVFVLCVCLFLFSILGKLVLMLKPCVGSNLFSVTGWEKN